MICQAGPATPTSTAILAVLLTVLVIFICVVFWRRRRRLLKKTVDGLYVQFSTPHHLETVFLGEMTIPYDHTFTEGNVLVTDVLVNQFCLKYTLTVTWGLRSGNQTRQPDPANVPLPESILVSKKLARLMLGTSQYMTMTTLLKYSCGLATPIPMGVPRLVDAGWSDLGAKPFPLRRRVDKLPSAPHRVAREEVAINQDDQDLRSGTGAVYEPLN